MRLARYQDELVEFDPTCIESVPPSELVKLDEADRLRVRRSLRKRRRYRYVSPLVRVVGSSIRVQSPCCSRNVDPSGGMIDIACLLHLRNGEWRLYRVDRAKVAWLLDSVYANVEDLLRQLNEDPDRLFWQ